MLLRLTMLPWPLAAIPGASAATRKNGARTLLANILSNAATSNSAVAAKTDIPALLMRMSTSPASLARRGTSVASLRSAPTKLALPPAAVISSTVSAPRAASRPWTRTSAPSRAKSRATARPMPDVAPVTNARCPSRLSCFVVDMAAPEQASGLAGTRLGLGPPWSPVFLVCPDRLQLGLVGDVRQPFQPAGQVPVPIAQQLHRRRQQNPADDRRVDQNRDRQSDAQLLEDEQREG